MEPQNTKSVRTLKGKPVGSLSVLVRGSGPQEGGAGTRYVHIRAAAPKRQAQLDALAGQRFGC